jgi:hypothetical protein
MNDGSWMPGDIVAPDGWSSIPYTTLEQCQQSRDRLNQNMSKTDYANLIKGVCQTLDPTIPRQQI